MSEKQNLEVSVMITGLQAAQAGIERLSLGIQRIGETVSRASEVMAAWAGAEGFSAVIKAATETNVVLAQLRRVLIQHGDASEESVKALSDQADALEHLTGVSQDTTLSIDRMLISSGATASQAMQLTPLIMDLSSAMSIDATSAAMRLSGAFQGQAVEFGRLHIQAGNVNDLIGQLSGRFQGEAEAAFKARGALGQLSVATEESKRALGGLISEPSNRFFGAIAEGLVESTASLNAFKDDYPRAFAAMNHAGEMAGRVIGENLGKILLFGAALASVIVVIKSASTVIEVFTTALTSLGMSATAASASISLVGAAMAGWAIGTWVSQIQVLGFTIGDYFTLPLLQAQKAMLRFQRMFGGMSAEKFKHDMADVQQTINDIMNPPSRSAPKSGASAPAAPGGAGAQSYTMQDLERAEQKLDIEREAVALNKTAAELIEDQASKEKSLPIIYAQEIGLLNQKRALIVNAFAVKGILTEAEESKKLQEVDKELLAVKKEQYEFAMKGTELFFSSLNRELEAVRDNITLQRELYQASPIYTELQKRRELLQSYAEEKRAIQEAIDLLKQKLALTKTEPEKKAVSDEITSKQHELSGVNEQSAKVEGGTDPTNFVQSWQAAWEKIRQQGDITWKSIADGLTSHVGSAINTASQAFAKVLMGTMAWKEAIYQVGEAILESVITSMLEAAAEAAIAWLPGAILSLIATDGASGASAADVFGAAEGGYTGPGGKYDVAGVVHRGEFVFDQASVNRIGLGNLGAMHKGAIPNLPSSTGSGSQIHIWNDHSAMLSHIQNNSDVQHAIVKVVQGNRHQIIPRTA